MITATQIKINQVLKIGANLFRVLKVQHITPGKGNAVVQTELRNLKTKNKDNIRFRSTETVELADVTTRNVNFLYQDGAIFNFMDPVSFEQFEISADILEDAAKYLKTDTVIMLSTFEEQPIGITLPSKLSFKVLECDPPSKGVAGSFKDAQLENNLKVKVPLFIKPGDVLIIDTETGQYNSKE